MPLNNFNLLADVCDLLKCGLASIMEKHAQADVTLQQGGVLWTTKR